MKSKIVALSLGLVIALSTVTVLSYPREALALTTQANAQRTKVWQYLVAYSNKYPAQVPIWKIKAVFGELDKANYFAMTRVQKLAYLQANLPNSFVLGAVVWAEGFNTLSAKYFSSPAQLKAAVQNERVYVDYWNQFFNDVFFDANGKVIQSRIAEWGTLGAFTNKKYWSSKNLDVLYSKFWTDFKKSRSAPEFGCTEKERLKQIWLRAGFETFAKKNFRDTGQAVPVGFTGDSPIEDLLLFLPVEKVISLVGKGALTWAKASRVPGLASAAKLAEQGSASASAYVGRASNQVVRAISRPVEAIYQKSTTVLSRYLGHVYIDLEKMFARSSIKWQEWPDIAVTLVRSLSRTKETSFARYADADILREAIGKTRIVRKSEMPSECAGVCYTHTLPNIKKAQLLLAKIFGKTEQEIERTGGDFSAILVADDFVHTAGDFTVSNTYAHEVFHAIVSKIRTPFECAKDDAAAIKLYGTDGARRGGYRRLNEGFTDYHTRNYMLEAFEKPAERNWSGYPKEVQIARAIQQALSRKYKSEEKAEDIVRWIYFKSPKLDQFDYYFRQGFTSQLTTYLRVGRDDVALSWLNRMYK